MTITIGGNDAGFSSVITQCALPWPFSCSGDITTAQNYIRNTLPAICKRTGAVLVQRAGEPLRLGQHGIELLDELVGRQAAVGDAEVHRAA